MVTEDDFSEISGYRPLDEHAHIPHVTAFRHGGSWFLGFQLALRHPSRSHRGLSSVYNLWGRLGNTDRRFVDAFNRLAQLRSPARYLEGDLPDRTTEVEELLKILDELERHASHLAEAPLQELPEKYNLIAARPIQAGELIGSDASTLLPTPR